MHSKDWLCTTVLQCLRSTDWDLVFQRTCGCQHRTHGRSIQGHHGPGSIYPLCFLLVEILIKDSNNGKGGREDTIKCSAISTFSNLSFNWFSLDRLWLWVWTEVMYHLFQRNLRPAFVTIIQHNWAFQFTEGQCRSSGCQALRSSQHWTQAYWGGCKIMKIHFFQHGVLWYIYT